MEFFDFDGASQSVEVASTLQEPGERENDFSEAVFLLNNDDTTVLQPGGQQDCTPQDDLTPPAVNQCDEVNEQTDAAVAKEASKEGPSSSTPTQRKNPHRFSKSTRRILNNWLAEHSSHPYPTEQEKVKLSEATGLNLTQVSNWLANARRRGKPDILGSAPELLALPRKVLAPEMSLSELTPFERWTYIPPESEPVAPADLLAAYYAAPGREAQPEPASVPNEGPPESTVDSYTRVTESESQFSLDRATTTTRTTSSAYSQHSSLASSRRGGVMRRRRYKPRATNTASSTKAKKAPKQFQCTFCLDSFSTKYDWQRHERTQYLALDSWTCTPLGGIEFVEGVAVCAFCRAIDPSNDHLEEHNYAECRVKNCFDRSFFRKDHLNQHLRLVHGVKYSPWMDEWKRTREHIQSRCGFCTKPLYSWKERVEHIADHYKAGACMKNWKGGLGFPPDVQQLVESTVVYPSPNALSAQGADKANTLDGAIFGTAQAGHEQTNASQRRSTFAPSNLSSVQYADSSSSGSMSAGGTTPEQTWGAAPQEPLLMNHSFSPPVYTFPNYSTACQTPEATFAFSGATAPDAMIPGKDYPLGFSYPIGKLQPDQNFHESGGMVDTRFSGALAPHAPKS